MQHSEPLVIATYSRRMRLQLPGGEQVGARIKGKRLRPVCGDRVLAEPIEQEADWLITAIAERENELTRPNQRGQAEVMAANIEMLVVVAAATPEPDWFIVDRYLSAAEDIGAAAAVVYNKTDLDVDAPSTAQALDEYRAIGYPTLRCSATTGAGIEALGLLLAGKSAIIVGQSGVGKSSIINRLTGVEQLTTATISKKRGAGRHTTVNSVMLELPGGGRIIDSPGVRDYAPALVSLDRVGQGFREISSAAQACRFANCRHVREPDCAVKRAIDAGAISARRYESYKRLLNLTKKLSTKL
ncbi:MAG: ribosome small subunit-dependent GTPase A [Gammaproteobacteria bacterium]|nr:ribosome small subunit-dependent GTPase A [Gammaproteobacteria bacterium]